MTRLSSTLQSLQSSARKALIPFLTAGYPDRLATVPLLHACVAGGADVIELGMPFSDPMADGPSIQRASEIALQNGLTVHDVLSIVRSFRIQNQHTPIVLMGYTNPVEAMGYARFVEAAVEVGVDGILLVDYPVEEAAMLTGLLKPYAIDLIFLMAPTTTESRQQLILSHASGYIYYVSLTGVTGAGHLDMAQIRNKVAAIQSQTSLPVMVGFGVRDAESAKAIAKTADGVVIGSKLIDMVGAAQADEREDQVTAFLTSIREALDESMEVQA